MTALGMRIHLAALCLCALVGAIAGAPPSAAQQTFTSVWGSPLYRAEITVTGSKVTGTFTSLANPAAPAGTIAGQLNPDGNGFTAEWAQAIGPDTVRFRTSLRASADGSVLNGFRWSEGGQPAAFALHRAVGGQVPLPLGPDDLSKTASTSRQADERRATTVTAAPDTTTRTTSPDSNRAAARTFTFDAPSGSALLAREYDRDHFVLRLRLTWTKPGSVLDTVGINAAAVGSWCVVIDGDGYVTLQVYAPAVASGTRSTNGWHVLPSPIRTRPGEEVNLTVTRSPQDWTLSVAAGGGPRRSTVLALAVPASGQPIYLGDFPGDNTWPAANRPLRGFVGTVEVTSFVGKSR